MNLVVLLIAAWLPLAPILFILLKSGSFGKGSIGTLMKLFFLGVAAAVPAFLMEAGALLALTLLLRAFPETAFGGNIGLISVILRCLIASALIEECWKHFMLRLATWDKMTMETVADGIAAAGVVSVGFSALIYGFWQAGYVLVPADMEMLRGALPEFLFAGPVVAFLFAILFIFSHFGFSGLMGALYGIAKGSEQKSHGRRAGIMLFLSGAVAVLAHAVCMSLICWGIRSEQWIWTALGLAAQTILGLLMAAALSKASDAGSEAEIGTDAEKPVDFADSEEFAEFAEAAGGESAAQDPEPSASGFRPAETETPGDGPMAGDKPDTDPAGTGDPGPDTQGTGEPAEDSPVSSDGASEDPFYQPGGLDALKPSGLQWDDGGPDAETPGEEGDTV